MSRPIITPVTYNSELRLRDICSCFSSPYRPHLRPVPSEAPVLANVSNAVPPLSAALLAYLGASYSNAVDFLGNTGTGETLLSAQVVDEMDPDILGWIFEEKVDSPTLVGRMSAYQGQDFLDLFPVEVQQGIAEASAAESPWCVPPDNQPQALCGALATNSPSSRMQTNDEPYTLEWCHSPDDLTVPFLGTQLFLLLLGKPNVQPFVPPLDDLQPRGSHVLSHFICGSALPVFLSRAEGAQLLVADEIPAGTCGNPSESMAPSPTPSSTPSMDNSSSAVAFSVVSALGLVIAVTVWIPFI